MMLKIHRHWFVHTILVLLLACVVTTQADDKHEDRGKDHSSVTTQDKHEDKDEGQSLDGSIFIHVEKKISEDDGGKLKIKYKDTTYATFKVHPDTIEEDVLLTIDALLYEEGDEFQGFAVDFGPDGLKFKDPHAELSLEEPLLDLYRGSRMVIYDESGQALWESDVIDDSVSKIKVKFKHFSLYYFERR